MQSKDGVFRQDVLRNTMEAELRKLVQSIIPPTKLDRGLEREFMERGIWSAQGAGMRKGHIAPRLYNDLKTGPI